MSDTNHPKKWTRCRRRTNASLGSRPRQTATNFSGGVESRHAASLWRPQEESRIGPNGISKSNRRSSARPAENSFANGGTDPAMTGQPRAIRGQFPARRRSQYHF